MAPTNAAKDDNHNSAVIPIDQTNKGIRSALILIGSILIIVEIKFTAPRILLVLSIELSAYSRNIVTKP